MYSLIKRNKNKFIHVKSLFLLGFFLFSFFLQTGLTLSFLDFSSINNTLLKGKVCVNNSHKTFESGEYSVFEKEAEEDDDYKNSFLLDLSAHQFISINFFHIVCTFPTFKYTETKIASTLYIIFRNFRL